MMRRSVKTLGFTALAVACVVVLMALAMPGCIDQVQDNSPISISQGRAALSVTCSADGSVAYVTDGRNVYRFDRNAPGNAESWQCILSQGQRLEMAARHDPREPLPAEQAPQNPDQKQSDGAAGQDKGK